MKKLSYIGFLCFIPKLIYSKLFGNFFVRPSNFVRQGILPTVVLLIHTFPSKTFHKTNEVKAFLRIQLNLKKEADCFTKSADAR